MKNPAEFDAFYKDARDRLLLEAYALTGDLHVSRTAVRDAFTAACHHWGKVQRLEDREAWLRPLVWKRAQHRHAARPWHKEKDLPDGARATLDALASLPANQRKALVLTHLSPLPMADIAREIGIPQEAAERELQTGTAAFALARETPSTAIRSHIEDLRPATLDTRWPRSTIIRRAGVARRRTHTALGVVATTAAVVLSGMVVAQGETPDAALSDQGFERRATRVEAPAPEPALDADLLLDPEQVTRIDTGVEWAETATSDNTSGSGLVLPCQSERFADPEGVSAFVRTFEGTEDVPKPRGKRKKARAPEPRRARAAQMVELSTDEDRARAAYATARDWFAGCTTERLQLLGVHELRGVGDQATLFTLRAWNGATRTVQVGVARTGQITTTTMGQVEGLRPGTGSAASMLAAAVNSMCGIPGSGSCASPPKARAIAAPPAGEVEGMLSELDLPPVARARGPWFGTKPARAKVNVASTRCDRTAFSGNQLTHNLTRTFLFPQDKGADEFGLTQSVAMTRSAGAAKGFVRGVRTKLTECAREGFGTEVSRLVDRQTKKSEVAVWRVEVEVSDSSTLEYLMAIMRHKNMVSQLGFVPSRELSIDQDDFVWLTRRAMERLPRLKLEGR